MGLHFDDKGGTGARGGDCDAWPRGTWVAVVVFVEDNEFVKGCKVKSTVLTGLRGWAVQAVAEGRGPPWVSMPAQPCAWVLGSS
jgi:hypothetical protein